MGRQSSKKKVAIGIVVVLLVACIIIVAALFELTKASDSIPIDGVRFSIEEGMTINTLAKQMESAGLIKSALAFQALSKIYGSAIKIGNYHIANGLDSKDILMMFLSGKQILVDVTIPEGLTISQIGSLLEKKGVCTKDSFITACGNKELIDKFGIPASNLEGFLFPDTYKIPEEFPATEMVEKMVSNFFERLVREVPEIKALSNRELLDKVILASIIEREYRASDEAPLIASVFNNRLKIHMPFQSCATVVYIITEILGKAHPDRLFNVDLEIDNPYNTYINNGLPPGPIANPGLVALNAAFKPANTDYLFFVLLAPGESRHHFSKTYAEHSNAANTYVKALN